MNERLQKTFEHANNQVAQENFEFAAELLTQCILGDPLNTQYVRGFIEGLERKYKNNRKGAAFARFHARGARTALKKAAVQGHWQEVLKNGLAVLKVNPWDAPTLRAMATASEHLGGRECQMYYLKCALVSNPNDPETNTQCAKALAERGEFDQAIACWHRVEQARPGDQEAPQAIAELLVRKTVQQGQAF
jgi:tetratricopeptide (TPR) repeat protein